MHDISRMSLPTNMMLSAPTAYGILSYLWIEGIFTETRVPGKNRLSTNITFIDILTHVLSYVYLKHCIVNVF